MTSTNAKLAQQTAQVLTPHPSQLIAPKERSPWDDAKIRFLKNKAAVFSLLLLIIICLLSAILPLLLKNHFATVDYEVIMSDTLGGWGPTLANSHYLGTDDSGRDLLARILIGARVSLLIGLGGTLASVTLGVLWGATAGFLGGKVDIVLMRIVDILYAIPYLMIVILVMTFLKFDSTVARILVIILTISLFSWMDMARVVRGQALAIKSKAYIEAAHAIGLSKRRIILQHVIPNLLGVVVVYTTVIFPGVIITESVLSFLGLGVQEPLTSLGALIHDGANLMSTSLWMLIFPSIALTMILYCANYIGDGMRDALDPKDR
jgi:oligopeptide transport system permease protein